LVSNSTTSSYSTTAGALVIGGGVGVSGNVNAGKLQVGTISYSDTNILGMFQSSAGTYNQIILQNGQANPNASADIVVSNDLGTASTYYGDFGMNSSNFGGTGSLNQPSAVYLTGTSGDLVLGTTTANAIHFVVSSSTTDALTIFSNSSVVSNGNVIISNTVASTSTTTGALVVNGGAGIAGNLNIGGANVIVASGSIMANGVYTETTTTPGVYLGNLNATPRIGFFNGNASANWQIDNNVGSFRWYTPGVTRMTIDYFGNLTMPGATFITNSAVSTSSSTGALVVSGGVGVSGALFVGGNISDFAGSVRDIVNNAQSGAYVLTGADNGKMINITTGGVTINTGIFNAGNNITIYNNSGSSQTITQGSGVTMYLAGTATTGNRTLLQHGLATIVCVANSTTFVISGAGLQ
jgi:hypothetical protein